MITMSDFIDRDKVLETIFNVMSDNKIVHKHRALNRNIKQIPKADTDKHAHWGIWDEDTNTYECSNCKNPFTLLEGTPEQNTYFYCPYCGYKMNKINND